MSRSITTVSAALLATGLCLAAAAPANANLVQNPNFTPTDTSNAVEWLPGGSYGGVPTTTIAGWTGYGGEAEGAASYTGAGTGFWDNSSVPGGQGLTGYVGFIQGSVGYLAQTVNGLAVGDTYSLSFYTTARVQTQDTYGRIDGTSAVIGGTQVANAYVYAQGGNGSATTSFEQLTGTFVASAASETLTFNSFEFYSVDLSVLIANVDIEDVTHPASVPEPASLGLLAGAAAMIGMLRRRAPRAQ